MRVLVLERIKHHTPAEASDSLWQRPNRTLHRGEIGAGSGFQGCDSHGVPSRSSLEKRNKRRGSYRGELRRQEPLGSWAKLGEGTKILRHQEKDYLNAAVFKLQLKK